MADISDRNAAVDALVRATINGSEADIVEALFRIIQSAEPEPVVKKYENQKTPCTDECYVRISDLKEAILNNPYDPAKGEIGGYLRYLKYNTPFKTDAWIPVHKGKPKAWERVLLCLDNNEITIGWWSDEYDQFDSWDDSVEMYKGVVAWMPLPEAYGGEEDGRS